MVVIEICYALQRLTRLLQCLCQVQTFYTLDVSHPCISASCHPSAPSHPSRQHHAPSSLTVPFSFFLLLPSVVEDTELSLSSELSSGSGSSDATSVSYSSPSPQGVVKVRLAPQATRLDVISERSEYDSILSAFDISVPASAHQSYHIVFCTHQL